jgi:virulence-associated protein VagC
MNAIRIRRKLESETLHLPELKPLMGKNVEIIVQEEPIAAITPGTGDWDAAVRAVEDLEDYDFDAFRKQREYDVNHAKDHLG